MKPPTTAVAAVLLAGLALSGCSTSNSTPDRPAYTTSSDNSDGTEQTTPSDGQQSGQYQWGETHQGSITTTVSAPTAFTTGPYAAPKSNAPAWRVDITFTNTLTRPFPLVALQINATTNGRPAQQVFDSSIPGGGIYQTGPLMPGKTVTVTFAYLGNPDDPKRVTVASMSGTNAASWSR